MSSYTESLPQATFASVKMTEADTAHTAGDTEQACRILAYTIAESVNEHDRTILRTVLTAWRHP